MGDKAARIEASGNPPPISSPTESTESPSIPETDAESIKEETRLNAKRPREVITDETAQVSEDSVSPSPTGDVVALPEPKEDEESPSTAANTPISPSPTELKKSSGQSINLGRRGDARMHRAVAARLEDPSLSLLEALIAGGFSFPQGTDRSGVSDRNVYDSDNVLLCQRKNQLSRRLRLAKKSQQNGGGVGSHHVLKKVRVDGGLNKNGHLPPGLQGYMHPSFPTAFNPAAAGGFGGLNGPVEGPSRAHELMQMVLNSQNAPGAPFLQDRRALGHHGNVMDFNGTPMGANDMVDRSRTMDQSQQFQNLGNDMTNSFLHPQGRFVPPGAQPQLLFGGQLPQMNPHFHPGFVQGNAVGAPGAPIPSSDQLLQQPPQSQGTGPNGVRSNDLDRYLELYSNSVGMDRDSFQNMMMNRQNPNSNPAAVPPVLVNNGPNGVNGPGAVNPSPSPEKLQPQVPAPKAESTSPEADTSASPRLGEGKGEKENESVKSESSTLDKKEGGGSVVSSSTRPNDAQTVNGNGSVNGDTAPKFNHAMTLYKTQHKMLLQDCLVAAGFDQAEVRENGRLYSDFEEIVKKEAV